MFRHAFATCVVVGAVVDDEGEVGPAGGLEPGDDTGGTEPTRGGHRHQVPPPVSEAGVTTKPARRQASAVLPREIVHATELLTRVEQGLPDQRHLPALVLWADRDIAFRDSELARWQREWPQAEVVPVPGAGHFVQSDAPEACADAIRDWYHRAFATAAG